MQRPGVGVWGEVWKQTRSSLRFLLPTLFINSSINLTRLDVASCTGMRHTTGKSMRHCHYGPR